MLIDLRNLPPEGMSLDRVIEASRLRFPERDFRLQAGVRLDGRLESLEDDAYRLQGRLSTSLGLDCVRCLEPMRVDLAEELELIYLPQEKNIAREGEDDRGLSVDDMAVAFYRDEQIDLGHMIWEQIQLALPMKPLCKQGCRGLCPSCGVNWNQTHCDCKIDETDPRWSGLKALL